MNNVMTKVFIWKKEEENAIEGWGDDSRGIKNN